MAATWLSASWPAKTLPDIAWRATTVNWAWRSCTYLMADDVSVHILTSNRDCCTLRVYPWRSEIPAPVQAIQCKVRTLRQLLKMDSAAHNHSCAQITNCKNHVLMKHEQSAQFRRDWGLHHFPFTRKLFFVTWSSSLRTGLPRGNCMQTWLCSVLQLLHSVSSFACWHEVDRKFGEAVNVFMDKAWEAPMYCVSLSTRPERRYSEISPRLPDTEWFFHKLLHFATNMRYTKQLL